MLPQQPIVTGKEYQDKTEMAYHLDNIFNSEK